MNDSFEKGFHRSPSGDNGGREGYGQQGRDRQDGYGHSGNNKFGRSGRPRFQNSRERINRGYGNDAPYHSRRGFGEGSSRPYRPQGEGDGRGFGYRSYDDRRPRHDNFRTGREGDERPFRQSSYPDRGNATDRPYRPRFTRSDEYNTPRNTERSGRYDHRPSSPYRRNDNEYGHGRAPYDNAGRPPYGTNRRPAYDPNRKYSQNKRREYIKENFDPNKPIRLNKYLANAGVCSRRDADKYIEAGVVSVNGKVVTELGVKVMRSDEVKFHDAPVTIEKKVYVLLNKPKGYVTTSEDPENRKTVMDLVRDACSERIYPVGRLDRNTTGVLLLTNDGELASKLTHPQFLKKKIYHVVCDKNVSAADMRQIAEGITLDDGEIHADAIEYASPTDKKEIGIEIHSGRNRIVRRIFESLGYHVIKLDRVYFAGLTKKRLSRGDWRYLTEKEVNMLRMGAFD